MSDFASAPIDKMTLVGNSLQPQTVKVSLKRDSPKRKSREPVQEIIVALGTDVEGDATSYYLAKRLSRPGLKITRIAHGLPAGAGLEFADEITLGHALAGRREL